jgi:hypothetical protein
LIPRNVEILGSDCFSGCKSLSSITFESDACSTRIESEAFYDSSLQSILIPSTILFIASDAVEIASQILLIDGSLTASNIVFDLDHCIQIVDFRPIQLKVKVKMKREHHSAAFHDQINSSVRNKIFIR